MKRQEERATEQRKEEESVREEEQRRVREEDEAKSVVKARWRHFEQIYGTVHRDEGEDERLKSWVRASEPCRRRLERRDSS